MKHALLALAASLGLCVMGCGEELPLTQVMVIVGADPMIQTQTTTVRVEMTSGQGSELDSKTFTAGANGFPWPRKVAIIPKDNDASRTYEVVATAFDASGSEVATIRATSGFIKGKTVALNLTIADNCIRELDVCPDNQTCTTLGCADAEITVTRLISYDPNNQQPIFLAPLGNNGDSDASIVECPAGAVSCVCQPEQACLQGLSCVQGFCRMSEPPLGGMGGIAGMTESGGGGVGGVGGDPDECNAPGVWYDAQTELCWEVGSNAPRTDITIEEIKVRCQTLNKSGRSDWRMPSISEALTHVRSCSTPCPLKDGTCTSSSCAPDLGASRVCYGCADGGGRGVDGCYWDEAMGGVCHGQWRTATVDGDNPSETYFMYIENAFVAVGPSDSKGSYYDHTPCVRGVWLKP